jgi:uncharacterized membrane protein
MSDLIAIAYADRATVERARDNLHKGIAEGVVQVEDVVVMSRSHEGKLEVHQGSSGVAAAATGSGIAGGLIGLIFLAPLFGMAVGAVAGGAAWKSMFGDVGIAEAFVRDLSEKLLPGSAALIVLVRDADPDRVLPHLRETGHVITTTLPPEAEAQLEAALAS